MEILNYQEIMLDSESLEKAKEDFDILLQKLFRKMEQNDSDEGSITLKVDVKMQVEYMPDEKGESRRITKPVLKHKVTSTVPVKDNLDGTRNTGMALVYDDELKRYVLKYVSEGGQRSIFDDDFPDVVNGEAREVESDVPQIGTNNMIEGPCDEPQDDINGDSKVIDADYKEITGQDKENEAGGGTEGSGEDEYGYEEA